MRGIRPLLAAGMFAASAAASAATVTILWDSPVLDLGHDSVGVSLTGAPSGVHAGRFAGRVTAHPGLNADEFVDSVDDFYAYCYDLLQLLATNKTYDVKAVTDQDVLNFLGAVNAKLPGGDSYDWLHPADKYVGAAIQLGIWEALYEDNAFNLSGGNARFSSVDPLTVQYFNEFVALLGTSADLDASLVMHLANDSKQDVITGRRVPQQQVPEPGTVLLIGLGAAAAALARRRKR